MTEGAKLKVDSRTRRGVRVIAVAGEVDLSSVSDIQTHIDAAFTDGHSLLVIDLEQVPFLDSSVLHTLGRAVRRARRVGGDMAIACADPSIRRMLAVFGLARDVTVYDDAELAVTALAREYAGKGLGST